MTRDDVIQMLTLLKAAYPAFYSKMSAKDAEAAITLWIEMFSGDDPRVIALAVKHFIETHDSYPPSIAAIKNRAKQILQSVSGDPTPDDLWTVFARACGNGIYGAKEEFDRLPPVLKRFAGSPQALYDYAVMDGDVFNSVVRGQFFKRIEAMQQQEEFDALTPPDIRAILSGAARKIDSPDAEREEKR
jgi:hypothetical protein